MAAIAQTITNGTVKFALGATKPVSWSAGTTDASCQVTSSQLVPTANTIDVPATYCQGASQTAALSTWALQLAGLQDMTEATGITMFLFTNDAKEGWVQIVGPDKTTAAKILTAEAHVTFLAGTIFGEAGSPLTFELTIPCREKPTLVQSVAT